MMLKVKQQFQGLSTTRKQQSSCQYEKLAVMEEMKKDGESRVSVAQKLRLGALLLGGEATNNFFQQNFLSFLQLLGTPFGVTTLLILISAPTTVVLLSSLGWWADRSSNPQRRKTAATLLAAGILMTGVTCVLVASLMHLHDLYHSVGDAAADAANTSSLVTGDVFSACENDTGASGAAGVGRGLGQVGENGSEGVEALMAENGTGNCGHDPGHFEVPFKAVVGMVGFVLVDIGFDSINSFTKAYIATCSPASERASSLVVSVIMASAGGLMLSAVGMLDIGSFPGLPAVKGGSGSFKVAVEAVLVLVSVAVGLPVTLLTGWTLTSQAVDPLSRAPTDEDKHAGTKPSVQESSPDQDPGATDRNLNASVGFSQRVSYGTLADRNENQNERAGLSERVWNECPADERGNQNDSVDISQRVWKGTPADERENQNDSVEISQRVLNGTLAERKENQSESNGFFVKQRNETPTEGKGKTETKSGGGGSASFVGSHRIDSEFDNRNIVYFEEMTEMQKNCGDSKGTLQSHVDAGLADNAVLKRKDSISSPEKESTCQENLSLLSQILLRTTTAETETEPQNLFKPETLPHSKMANCHSQNDNPKPTIPLYESENSSPLRAAVEKKKTQSSNKNAATNQICCHRGVKVRLSLIMASSVLTVGLAFLFSVDIADYVSKAIFLGQPDAEPGTESHLRYEEGLTVASRGFCVHYASYLLFNLLNPYILHYIGYRTEFLLVQLLTVGCMVVLALTASQKVFFALAAATGVHRVTFHVLPFVAATRILQASDRDSKQLGFVISLIAAAVPLGDVLLVSWMGPLAKLTGDLSVPLWMAASFGSLSALAFFSVGPIE